MAEPTINETLLEEKLIALEEARSWSPRVISRLETSIRTDDDYDLFRVNPIKYAADKNMQEGEALDLFLYGTKFGLFEMDWHLICAICGHVVESLRELSDVHAHFNCAFCGADNNVSMDDYIHVSFTISPLIRRIAYHQPLSLPIEDYYFRYHFSKGALPFEDGNTILDLLSQITRVMTFVSPHESIERELDLDPGLMQAKDLVNSAVLALFVREDEYPEIQNIPLRIQEGQFEGDFPPQTVDIGITKLHFKQAGGLQSGKATIQVINQTDERSPFWLVHYPPDYKPEFVHFEPFLSGKRLLTHQTFRDLFRTQVIRDDDGISVKDITFLFTDLKGSTDMYDRIGDAKAYYLVRQHFETLGYAVVQNSGAIVKTIGDAVMATFLNPVDAVNAALAMLKGLQDFNRTISDPLILKIGIHKGHSIAVTLNDRLDYFGQTVNISARVQGLADANEIYITEDAYAYPGVQDVLSDYDVDVDRVGVKGVREKLQVYRVKGSF